jgi:serine/threonine-protein kinase ATR
MAHSISYYISFKSVFYEYFLFNFPDPSAWFSSRLAYTRTSAVLSMVGYVIGLGDRHSENILFDNTNGDTVHVDFNCLFEKVKKIVDRTSGSQNDIFF